jgi:hypothetical protein
MEVGCVRTYLEPPKKMQNNSIQLYCSGKLNLFDLFHRLLYYTGKLKGNQDLSKNLSRISYDFLFKKIPQKVWWKKKHRKEDMILFEAIIESS